MLAAVLLLIHQTTPLPVELASLTEATAARFDGRLVSARVDLVDDGQRYGAWVCHGNDGPDGVERSVWSRVRLPKGKGVVVGVLAVVRHPPTVGPGGTAFPGFVELRLTAGD